jgi:hypothetical protein
MTEHHRRHLAVHVITVSRSEEMLPQNVYSPNPLGGKLVSSYHYATTVEALIGGRR